MTRNLVEDEAIPGDTRRLAQTVMTKWLARKLIRDAFRFLQQKNWRELYGTAEALQEHCGLKTRALVLRSLARVCEYFPPARSLALLLNDLRKVLARRKTLPLERELRAYARLLERPEDTR